MINLKQLINYMADKVVRKRNRLAPSPIKKYWVDRILTAYVDRWEDD